MNAREATLRGRKGAYSMHARNDPQQITAGARAAFLRRFEREVDPEFALTAEERRRRGHYALKAYMTGLALASARARAGRVPAEASSPRVTPQAADSAAPINDAQ